MHGLQSLVAILSISSIALKTSANKVTLHFNKLPKVIQAKPGTGVLINCTIYDEKRQLDYEWRLKSQLITNSNKYIIKPIQTLPHPAAKNLKLKQPEQIFGSQLRIISPTILNNNDDLTCRAIDARTKQQLASTKTKLSVSINVFTSDDRITNARQEYECQEYSGEACPHLKGLNVKVNTDQSQADIDGDIDLSIIAFESAKSKVTTPQDTCRSDYVKIAACNYVYEVCPQATPHDPTTAVRLCREDCDLITLHSCRTAFKHFTSLIANYGQTQMIDCAKLAPIGQPCFPTGIKSFMNETQKCYTSKIKNTNSILDKVVTKSAATSEYFGLASAAENGQECLAWDNRKLLQNYPRELSGGHNYCRSINPAGMIRYTDKAFDFDKPWCFTRSNGSRSKVGTPTYCNIDSCSPIQASLNQHLPLILLISAALILLLITITVCVCCGRCRRKGQHLNKLESTHNHADATVASSFIQQPIMPGNHSGMKGVPSGLVSYQGGAAAAVGGVHDSSGSHSSQHLLHAHNSTLNQQPPSSTLSTGAASLAEIQPESIERMCEIGDGNFGKVHLAKIKGIHPTYQPHQPVLVKTVEADFQIDEQTEQEFCRELQNRAELRHANLICLKAFVRQTRICCLVYEYTEWSTLHKTLVASRLGVGAAGVPTHLQVQNFPYIVRQIADVMSYLEDKGYTHRDLAARNIMIMNGEFHVKIASLGMMRRDYMTDYAKLNWLQQMPFAMPLRWMSPESLQYGKFSIASDVWSFGIVLWEMFALGNRPWAEFSNDQVIELVAQRGQTLPRPPDCPEAVFAIMQSCWTFQPEQRPTFAELKNRFMASSSDLFENLSSSNSNSFTAQQQQRALSSSIPNTPGGVSSQHNNFVQNFNNNSNQQHAQLSSPSSNYNNHIEAASHYTNITANNSKQYQATAPSHNGLLSYHTISDGERDIQI